MGSLVYNKNNGISPEPEPEPDAVVDMVEYSHESGVMKKKGCSVTWEEVAVAVPISSKWGGGGGCKPLLSGVSGYGKPGEMVAIMGPSGCGKSTLLDSLAGRLASNAKFSGRIFINGRRQRLRYGTLAYMTQEQVLTWTLTVKETVYYSAELQLPRLMPTSQKRERADRTISEMGLQDCLNTRIGGWGSKGLSGGQRRRVSICLHLLTHPKLLLLDEPTSGLDSATSYYVMNQIAKLTHQYGMTVLAAIHQPSCQVFGLFTNLCLLSLGKTIYFGPTFAADQFFAANGFPCPDLQSPAEYYLITINPDFDKDNVSGESTPVEQVINSLVESYKSSEIYMEVQSEITTISEQEGDHIERRGNMQANFMTQCFVLTRRSFINMYRDLGYYWLRLAIYIALGFALGTLFHGIGSINDRVSVIMFISSFLCILAIGGFPSFMEEMKVFQSERLNGNYGVGSFVISHAISSLPYLVFTSLIPGAISYSLMGLQREAGLFTYFALVLLVSMLLVESLMMIVATMVPNLLMGIICGAGIQGLMILGAGFFRLPNDLPLLFWKYPVYYISFHRYALQGLYKNEFEGLLFLGGVPGEMILKDVLHIDMGYSKWTDLGILFGMVVAYKIILFYTIKTIERVRPSTFKKLETSSIFSNP